MYEIFRRYTESRVGLLSLATTAPGPYMTISPKISRIGQVEMTRDSENSLADGL